MSRWLMALPPVVFAALAGLFYGGMYRDSPTELPSTFIGREAPAVPPSGLADFAVLKDADLRTGKVTVVNFWSSWCPPCRAEHPVLQKMAEDGIRVAGINMRDDPKNAAAYLKEEGNPFFGLGFDPKGTTVVDWGVSAPPETFIINGDGTVAFRFIGPLVGSDYDQRFVPELHKALSAENLGG